MNQVFWYCRALANGPRHQAMLIHVYPTMFANTLRPSVKFGVIAIFVLGCGGTHKNSSDARGANAAERKCISDGNQSLFGRMK